jgi:hypothetical protein
VTSEPQPSPLAWLVTLGVMSAASEHAGHELIVAADGSIPADQLARLGVAPGAHLRVVHTAPAGSAHNLAGSLSGFPDLTWEDFERVSELAQHDLSSK